MRPLVLMLTLILLFRILGVGLFIPRASSVLYGISTWECKFNIIINI